jgi:hypothetical protein
MKRLTESQLRQVIREELVGLLNETSPFVKGRIFGSPRAPEIEDTEFDVIETGTEVKEEEELRFVTGAQIINQFPKFNQMKKSGQASLIPAPLIEFQIDYEFDLDDYNNKIKIAKDDVKKELAKKRLETYLYEIQTKKVIVFYYNPAELVTGGYSIKYFPLSTASKRKGDSFVSREAHEMTTVAGKERLPGEERTVSRKEIRQYENVLDIKVPEPKNLRTNRSSTTLPRMSPMGPVSQDAGMDALRARLDGEQGIGLPKGMRENKKRKR